MLVGAGLRLSVLTGHALVQDYLTQLHKKLDFVEQDESARQTAAYRDVAPELERLRLKALTKVREFLMTRCNFLSSRLQTAWSVFIKLSVPGQKNGSLHAQKCC